MNEKLYKFTAKGGRCVYGRGSWYLPKGKRPGKWMPIVNKLVVCASGYHLCREPDLVFWLNEEFYEAEATGDRIDSEDKVVVSQSRLIRRVSTWNERSARLFACDCAEHVLPVFEKVFPSDMRPREAIQAARDYASGLISIDRLSSARAAAKDAAGAAAWAAAWAAAKDAAGSAARAAARDAARAVAGAAVRDAERKWQTRRLMQYLNGEMG